MVSKEGVARKYGVPGVSARVQAVAARAGRIHMGNARPGSSGGEGSGSYWDLALDGMRRWWITLDRFERPVSQRLFELAQITSGDTVLDVATGIGEPALTVARQLGPSGRVIAIDQSAALLEFARDRAREAGVANIEFRQMDANALDIPDHSFQAIVCRWGLMFLNDLADALGRMRSGIVPGGRLAAAVWSRPEHVPIIEVRRSVMRAFDLPPSAVNPFSLSSPATLDAALSAGGFEEIHMETMSVAYTFGSVAEYIEYQQAVHGNRLAHLHAPSPERQAEFWSALAAKARAYAEPDGIVRLPSEALLVTARA
jgi:ubiquinone/menaquinone biosynthesis C-methylase UbiE